MHAALVTRTNRYNDGNGIGVEVDQSLEKFCSACRNSKNTVCPQVTQV